MTTVLNGLLGGVIAGVVATATTFLGDGSTVTAVSRTVFGDTAATSRWWNYLLCVGYGCIAGGVLVGLVGHHLVYGLGLGVRRRATWIT